MKKVKDFESEYCFDGLSIRNIKSNKIKSPVIDNHTGYYKIQLWKKNKYKSCYLHRLIAEHFIPNPDNKPEVNHINGIKTDNRIENLEWVTSKENVLHSINKLGKKVFESCYNFIGVLHIEYGVYFTAKQAADCLGVSKRQMLRILNGEIENKTNFIWSC